MNKFDLISYAVNFSAIGPLFTAQHSKCRLALFVHNETQLVDLIEVREAPRSVENL